MSLMTRVAGLILAVGAIIGIEAYLRPNPAWPGPRIALALGAMAPFALSAAAVGVFIATWWVVLRLDGPVRPAAKDRVAPLTGHDRLLSLGRSIAAYWIVGSAVILVILSDTRRGPFAWAAAQLPGGDTWFNSFALGLLVLGAPLLLLALLPRQARWPLVAGVQDVVRPRPSRRRP